MKLLQILLLLSVISLAYTNLAVVCEDVLQIPAGTQYQYSLSANGGKGPYTFSATGLPEGIAISNGFIVGISNVVGVFPVVVTVTDADKTAANKHIFVYLTSPAANKANTQSQITTTSTTIRNTNNNAGSSVLGDNRAQNIQTGSSPQYSQSLQSSQQNGLIGFSNNNDLSVNLGNGQQLTFSGVNNNFNTPQTSVTGVVNTNLRNSNIAYPISSQSPTNTNPTIVTNNQLIVPTTTPYITNYSFASSLQSTPTITSTQSVETAFQKQTNINKAISSLMSMIQGYNATLIALQSNIPNTTSLLNDAIRNQRIAQAQVNSIVTQNNTIANNIVGIEEGIKTLQTQVLTTTNTLNNSNAQIQTFQTKITQNYRQINETKNKIIQANNSMKDAQTKRDKAAAALTVSRDIILKTTQNITSTQNDINNAPVMLAKYRDQANSQKSVILSLQKQLQAAILGLIPIQNQIDYYTLIPTVGLGLIQQNKTILAVEGQNLAQLQPIYESAKTDVDNYNNLVNQLTTSMNSLQNQLAADELAYNNIMGSQNNQQGLFNNTLITIASQTQLLNRKKQQQQNLLLGSYQAALQVVSDTTNKVNLLTQTLNALNRRYTEIQNNIATTQQSLSEAIREKQTIDQSVNTLIQGGGPSTVLNSIGNVNAKTNINIDITKN